MTSTTLNTGLAPPSPSSSPRSPRVIFPPSPRRVTQQESVSIRSTISSWRDGELHIDEAVCSLLREAIKHKPYAREVYDRFVEEVRVEPKRDVLVGSRKALHAARIFARYADCVSEFEGIETSFVLSERTFKVSNPEIFGKL